MTLKGCSESIGRLRRRGYVSCLNPDALIGRVYWLTPLGVDCQRLLYLERDHGLPEHFVPRVDWKLYGRVSSKHRSTVIRTLKEPMQPSRIKRRAYSNDPRLRMSANNTRDVIRFLHQHGVVQRVYLRRRAHPLYELTDMGRKYQLLLCKARQRTWQA